MTEDDRIARLAAVLGTKLPGVSVGIGDDAAVLEPDLVWTIDEQVENVHFRMEMLSLEDLGWRSLMSAASDIAAMGADPWCALAAMVLPSWIADSDLDAISRGQADAARAIGAAIVGGNLSRGTVLSIATTVLGRTPSPILRSGARVGDRLWLAGPAGLASAGLRALERKLDLPDAIAAWRRPIARIEAGRAMRGHANAAIDVSDGLAIDASRIASASSVRLILDAAALRVPLGSTAAALGVDPLDLALEGGEDYALVCTAPESIAGFTLIGAVAGGEGVWLRDGSKLERLEKRGWDHFA